MSQSSISGPFGILVLRTTSDEADVRGRFAAFSKNATRVMGVVRVDMSSDYKAIVVLTDVENLGAIAAMSRAYELKVDVYSHCNETPAAV